ncbi:TRAP transporter large permease [Paracoccus sp. 1_MG-2023]|uniref:TRAP transporter large permease n=1 Tax=unclassified Paracoccus (in: a-proteobacteria) TaxID=2688777 RepID=UPI001C09D18D|nr:MULTISPECIES: TRAP transporter large permease [unclassified Paracoccus (in: a-proteobacteria)]MBU2958029.1 TRAP transporter large permease [Paracoccus sp. C2R09]MDO6670301.1 TRAP transporter large permease [Paracoccus sp. 1_MG-2023]
MPMIVMFATLTLLLVIGVPVGVALGAASFAYVMLAGMPDAVVLHSMVGGVDSFPLLAVPFFILAGHLMNTGGITERLFAFARALIGWMPGGLGHVNVGASVLFAGMSGAAVADAGGLGNVEIKAMRKAGYDVDFAVGVTAASSTIGPIIPPSLPMIVYGVMASASIGQLFMAGLVPGMLMALSLMIMVGWCSWRRGYPRDAGFSPRHVATSFRHAFLPLMTPALIVGGITTGAFTPTEAAVAAVAWTLMLGCFVYRSLTWRHLLRVMFDTLQTTGAILLIIASAAIFAWILISNQIAAHLSNSILSVSESPAFVMLAILLIVLVLGLFLETIAAITILVPVLLPVATSVGIDPVHLGVVIVLALMIGLLTPPVGLVLYVLAAVSGVSFERCVRATAPFLIPLVVVLLLVAFVPQLSLALPSAVGK